jgi:hypothetical protein
MSEVAEQQTQEVNVDQIMSDAYEPEAPLSAPTEQDGNADSATETPEPVVEQTGENQFVLKHKGKEIALDPEKAKAYAQKGYDYETKMREFKVQKKLYEQEIEKQKSMYGELAEINEFAKQNPAFEQLIQREWAKIQSGQDIPVAPEDKVTLLESRVNQLVEKLESQEQQNSLRKQAEMEAAQETQIESYKSKYSDFDWDSKDENGATLEDRIMQNMIDKGVKDFEIMADHVLKTELLARQQMEAKKKIGKQIQHANKHGLGQITKTSQQKTSKAKDIGNKSYDDLVAEGLAELGIEY